IRVGVIGERVSSDTQDNHTILDLKRLRNTTNSVGLHLDEDRFAGVDPEAERPTVGPFLLRVEITRRPAHDGSWNRSRTDANNFVRRHDSCTGNTGQSSNIDGGRPWN